MTNIILMPNKNRSSRLGVSGQTAVFVFILLIVGLSIGLSLAARTLQDFKSSGGSDFSSRAFSAAEAGAEDALRQDLSTINGTTVNGSFKAAGQSNATYSYTTSSINTVKQTIAQDAGQVFLDGFTGQVGVFWGNESDNVTGTTGENVPGSRPSLEITFYDISRGGSNWVIYKTVVNPDSSRANSFLNSPVNNASVFGSTITVTLAAPVQACSPTPCGVADPKAGGIFGNYYTNLATLNIPSSAGRILFIRIRALYNNASIAVEGLSGNLPTQGYTIVSKGTSGDSSRAVTVTKTSPPGLPPIFDYVLFNGSTSSIR